MTIALLALLLVGLGAHACLVLGARIRARLARGGAPPWGARLSDGLRLALVWGIAPVVGATIAVGSLETSEGLGAAGALLALVGGFCLAAFGFAVGFGIPAAFLRSRSDAPGAAWLRPAARAGLVAGGLGALLSAVPFLALGASRPSAAASVAGLLGLAVWSSAVSTAVFWRARTAQPGGPDARPSGALLRRSGVQVVLVLGVLWALAIPMSAVRLYGWIEPGALEPSNPALELWGLPIWLVPVALAIGARRGGGGTRRYALAVFVLAVGVQTLHVIGGLVTGDSFVAGSAFLVLIVFSWPLWYLTRAGVRQAFLD